MSFSVFKNVREIQRSILRSQGSSRSISYRVDLPPSTIIDRHAEHSNVLKVICNTRLIQAGIRPKTEQ